MTYSDSPKNPKYNPSTHTPHIAQPTLVRKPVREITLPISQISVWTICPASAIFTGSKGSVKGTACTKGTARHAAYKTMCDLYFAARRGQMVLKTSLRAACHQVNDTDFDMLYGLLSAMAAPIRYDQLIVSGAESQVDLSEISCGIPCRGVCDAYALTAAGTLHVWDIKTGKRPEHVTDELRAYALGLTRQLAGMAIGLIVLHVLQPGPDGPEDRSEALTPAALQPLEARIRSAAAAIYAADAQKPGPHCTGCSWHRSCDPCVCYMACLQDVAAERSFKDYSGAITVACRTLQDAERMIRKGIHIPGYELGGRYGIQPTTTTC